MLCRQQVLGRQVGYVFFFFFFYQNSQWDPEKYRSNLTVLLQHKLPETNKSALSGGWGGVAWIHCVCRATFSCNITHIHLVVPRLTKVGMLPIFGKQLPMLTWRSLLRFYVDHGMQPNKSWNLACQACVRYGFEWTWWRYHTHLISLLFVGNCDIAHAWFNRNHSRFGWVPLAVRTVIVCYSIMMLMKFADLSQSDRSNWVMRQVKDRWPRSGWDGCLTREK